MSLLNYYHRSWVAFDASNKDHRRHYADFVSSGSWGSCPVNFIVPDDQGNLITLIQRKLVEYYVNKEFVAEKQQFLIAQKVKKTVDKRSK